MTIKSFYSNGLKALLVASTCVLIIGCATKSTSTAPISDVKETGGVDINQLAGKWDGEYNSSVTQRRGAITFDLNKASGSAHGYIMMTSFDTKISSQKHGPREVKHQTKTKVEKQTPLTIDFVAVKGGKVNGDVTPYFDPRFNTTIFTNFEGTLSGNRMEGTFTSRIGQTGNSYSGTWWALRK